MKRLTLAGSLTCLLALSTIAEEPKVMFSVVQKTDIAKQISYETATAEQLKELQDQAKLDGTFFTKALSVAEKKWKEDKDLKSYPFPKGSMAPLKITVAGTFDSLEKAGEKLAELKKKSEGDTDKDKDKAKKPKTPTKKDKNKVEKKTPEEILKLAIQMVEAELGELKAKPQQ
jgi:hypothetical protein